MSLFRLTHPMNFTDAKGYRALTRGEKEFLLRYFGRSLDVERIDLHVGIGKRAYSLYRNSVRLPARFFQDGNAECEIDLSNAYYASVLVHEAAHIWQRQHGEFVTVKGLFLQCGGLVGIDPYRYDRSLVDPAAVLTLFMTGNIEQQGQMVQDLVFDDLMGDNTAKFSRVRRHLRTR